MVLQGVVASAVGLTVRGQWSPALSLLANLLTAGALARVDQRLLGGRWARAAVLAALAGGLGLNNLLETLLFSIGIPSDVLPRIWVMTPLVAIGLAGVLAWLPGRSPVAGEAAQAAWPEWWRLALCVLAYVVAYSVAGLIAWPFLRDFYQQWQMPPNSRVLMMQVVRGLVLSLLVLLMARRLAVGRKDLALSAGLVLSVVGGVAHLVPPNPFFPDGVRVTHLWEVGVSNFVFGAFAGWLLSAPRRRPSPRPA
jgi:hypothetical protein